MTKDFIVVRTGIEHMNEPGRLSPGSDPVDDTPPHFRFASTFPAANGRFTRRRNAREDFGTRQADELLGIGRHHQLGSQKKSTAATIPGRSQARDFAEAAKVDLRGIPEEQPGALGPRPRGWPMRFADGFQRNLVLVEAAIRRFAIGPRFRLCGRAALGKRGRLSCQFHRAHRPPEIPPFAISQRLFGPLIPIPLQTCHELTDLSRAHLRARRRLATPSAHVFRSRPSLPDRHSLIDTRFTGNRRAQFSQWDVTPNHGPKTPVAGVAVLLQECG